MVSIWHGRLSRDNAGTQSHGTVGTGTKILYMSGLAGLSRGTRVPICPGAFCLPLDRSVRDERDRNEKKRGNFPSRPLSILGFNIQFNFNQVSLLEIIVRYMSRMGAITVCIRFKDFVFWQTLMGSKFDNLIEIF